MLYQYLVIVCLIICISGCNLINTFRLRNANNDLTPQWPSTATEQTIPSNFDDGKPYVFATINGIDNFKLLVDTGAATMTLFDSPKVKQLTLEKGYTLMKGGWGDGENSTGYQTTINKLSLNGVTFNEVQLAYLPASKSQYFYSSEELVFDGVIGYDLMRHFNWQFDMRNNHISISQLPHQTHSNETALPFDTFMTRISVDSTINFGEKQVTTPLIIDTGSRHYLKLGTEFLNSHNVELSTPNITSADFGLSGLALHKRMNLPSLTLSDQTFNNVKTNIIRTDDEDEYLVVGNALLNQFITTVDYHSEKLYIQPYPEHQFTVQYNLLGLELRKLLSGNFIVRYVLPDLPAHNFDIKVGDIITEIDDKTSQQFSLLDWQHVSNTLGQHKICRTRDSQEKCFAVKAKHIKGYSNFN